MDGAPSTIVKKMEGDPHPLFYTTAIHKFGFFYNRNNMQEILWPTRTVIAFKTRDAIFALDVDPPTSVRIINYFITNRHAYQFNITFFREGGGR